MFSLAIAMLLQAPERPVWESVPVGISAAEVRALHPAGERVRYADDRVVISGERVSDNCKADVHILHRGGTVNAIVLQGEGAIAGLCGDAMRNMLIAHYGRPASAERRHPFMKRARTTYVWTRDGATLRFVHYAAGSGALAITDATNPSWEMSLSTSAEPVRL